MATLDGLVNDTRRLVWGPAPDDRPQFDLNTATGYAGSGGATVTVDNATMWKRGDILEFETDGLQLLATADGSGSTVAVEVWDGTDAAHTTDDEIIYRNPEYGRLAMEDAINQVVDLWLWPHVWTWHHGSLTWTSGDTTYNLDTYLEEVVRVYQYNIASQNRFHPIPWQWWDTELQVNTAVSTNSNLFRIRKVHDETATVYYTAKRRPDSADLANISADLEPLVAIGAAALVSEGAMIREGIDPTRGGREEGGAARDARTHTARFFILRDQIKAQLRREIPHQRRFVGMKARRERVY